MITGKKLTAVLVAVLIIILQIPGVFAQNDDLKLSENKIYAENSDMLKALGVFFFRDKEPHAVVTRGEFAAAVTDLFGWNDVRLDASAPFPFVDVKSDAPYRNQIKIMIYLGLMNGVNAVEFKPDEHVTYEQAVKVLVSALGYNAFAQQRGGYPMGYIILGRELDILLEGVETGTPLTWEMLTSVFVKATEAETLEIVGLGDTVSYKKDSDKTLLNVYHNIYKEKGIVTDNGETALGGKTNAGAGNIIIDGRKLVNALEGAIGLLGMYVDYYYRVDDVCETLLYAKAVKNRNDVLVIDAEKLLTEASDFSKTKIVYEDAENPQKTRKASVSAYADFIYNGAAYIEFMADSYKIKNGQLTLIDADLDSKYETVIADEYEDVFVSNISTQYTMIYSEYRNSIDYGKYTHIQFENAAGETITPADVKTGNVLSVFMSKDDTKIRCVLCDENFEIMVSSVEKDLDDIILYDKKQSYELSVTLETAITASTSRLSAPETGCRYTAYLNFAGEIAMIETVTPRYEYAYVLAVGQGKGLEANLGLMDVYLESDDFLTIKTRDKVLINKEKPEIMGKNIAGVSDFYDGSGNFIPQLVKIKRNSYGELTELEICTSVKTTENGFDPDDFVMNYSTNVADADGFHNASSNGDQIYNGVVKSVNGMYAYDENTKIFIIDDELHSVNTTDKTCVSVVSASEFSTDYLNATYKVYDADENWVAGAVVASRPSGYNERAFIVKECKEILDEFGEIRLQADGYWRGNLWTFRESRPGVFKEAMKKAGYADDTYLKPGDMLQITFDLKDEISNAELIVSPLRSRAVISRVLSGNYMANCVSAVMFGIPVSKTKGRLGIYTNKYFVSGLPLSAATYTILDAKTQKLEQVTISDIPTAGSWNADGTFAVTNSDIMIAAYRLRGVVTDIIAVLY